MWAIFRSPKSLELVPPDSETFQVRVPLVGRGISGGVGLKDLEGLLAAQDISEKFELPE
jgi:hypothetical protein